MILLWWGQSRLFNGKETLKIIAKIVIKMRLYAWTTYFNELQHQGSYNYCEKHEKLKYNYRKFKYTIYSIAEHIIFVTVEKHTTIILPLEIERVSSEVKDNHDSGADG